MDDQSQNIPSKCMQGFICRFVDSTITDEQELHGTWTLSPINHWPKVKIDILCRVLTTISNWINLCSLVYPSSSTWVTFSFLIFLSLVALSLLLGSQTTNKTTRKIEIKRKSSICSIQLHPYLTLLCGHWTCRGTISIVQDWERLRFTLLCHLVTTSHLRFHPQEWQICSSRVANLLKLL